MILSLKINEDFIFQENEKIRMVREFDKLMLLMNENEV